MCVCLFLLFVFLFVVSDVLFPNESDYFWLNVDTAHANQEIIWMLGMMSFSAREAFCAMRMADTRTHKSSNLMLGIGIIWSWGLFPVMTSLFKFHSSSSYVPFSSWFCPKMAGSYQTWWVPDSNFGWFPNLMTSFSEISGLHFFRNSASTPGTDSEYSFSPRYWPHSYSLPRCVPIPSRF